MNNEAYVMGHPLTGLEVNESSIFNSINPLEMIIFRWWYENKGGHHRNRKIAELLKRFYTNIDLRIQAAHFFVESSHEGDESLKALCRQIFIPQAVNPMEVEQALNGNLEAFYAWIGKGILNTCFVDENIFSQFGFLPEKCKSNNVILSETFRKLLKRLFNNRPENLYREIKMSDKVNEQIGGNVTEHSSMLTLNQQIYGRAARNKMLHWSDVFTMLNTYCESKQGVGLHTYDSLAMENITMYLEWKW